MSGRPIKRTFRGPERTLQRDGRSIEKASRLTPGKNNGWAVRILPSGLGDVTVRVNGTMACNTAPRGLHGGWAHARWRALGQQRRACGSRWRMRRSRKARTRPSRSQ